MTISNNKIHDENKNAIGLASAVLFFLFVLTIATAIAGFSAYSISLASSMTSITSEGYHFTYFPAKLNSVVNIIYGTGAGAMSLFLLFLVFVSLSDFKLSILLQGITGIFILGAIYAFVPFETKSDLIHQLAVFSYEQQRIGTLESGAFENSTPGKAFKIAIDDNDYETIKKFINNPKSYQGLNDNLMFEKLMIVQGISNQMVRDNFNQIYSDKYITDSEYSEFKLNSMKSLSASLQKPVDNVANTGNQDSVLISKL
jgi:hypothetical protein